MTADSLGALGWGFITPSGRILARERPRAGRLSVIRETKEVGCVGVTQLGRLARGRGGAED